MTVYEGLVFAIVTAVSFGIWTVFHQQASPHINPIFGAVVISLTAVVIGSLFIIPQLKDLNLLTNQRGIIFAFLAGIFAFAIDFFALKTYSSGMPLSIGGPIIIGGSIIVASIIGLFVLGESISLMKVLGIGLVVAGAVILSSL